MQAVIDDITQKRAKLLYLLAKQKQMVVSRDECAEMLAEDKLSSELRNLWETEGKEQLQIVDLNQSASRGNLDALKVGRLTLSVPRNVLASSVCLGLCLYGL